MSKENAVKIVSLEKRIAQLTMRAANSILPISDAQRTLLQAQIAQIATASHRVEGEVKFDNVQSILPKDEEFITVPFRCLSQVLIPGYWVDYSTPGVLEESVKLLEGQTVYKNHSFYDIEGALGSIPKAWWDSEGKESNGIPGINADYKIDALMNPRIARGLLMQPPSIHSTSLTVQFEFEYSHPELVEERRYRFYEMLGEEVDGEIVRFIATNILAYWEGSLVFRGADGRAKGIRGEDVGEDGYQIIDETELSASASHSQKNRALDAGVKTMKISAEQKKQLGITTLGEDVREEDVLKSALELAGRVESQQAEFDTFKNEFDGMKKTASFAEELIKKERAEVVRLATLAECGSEEGKLDEVLSEIIAGADGSTITRLKASYEQKVAKAFPNGGRSSAEHSAEIEDAGGVKQEQPKKLKPVSLH